MDEQTEATSRYGLSSVLRCLVEANSPRRVKMNSSRSKGADPD